LATALPTTAPLALGADGLPALLELLAPGALALAAGLAKTEPTLDGDPTADTGAALDGAAAGPAWLQAASTRVSATDSRTRFFMTTTIKHSPAAGRRCPNSKKHSGGGQLALTGMLAGAESYVHLDKADFQFCAAHFCVFPGEREPLHGHNYRVYVELGGPVDELGYVAEFGWLKKVVRELVATLDHRVLIAADCPELRVDGEAGQVRVHWREDTWLFPEGDVVRLPIKNTTAELLAGYIWRRIRDRLNTSEAWGRLTVEVEETPGQRAGVTQGLKEAP